MTTINSSNNFIAREPNDFPSAADSAGGTASSIYSSPSASFPPILASSNDTASNFSLHHPLEDAVSSKPTALLVFITACFLIIILASVCGNLLVIFAVYKNLRLRSKTNFFIVSLAFADLLVAILAMSFNASQLTLSPARVWAPLGPIFCKFWLASDIFFSTASTLHLCAIAVDRYMAILHPFHYQDIMNKRRVIGILTLIWVLSAALAYGPIFSDVYTRAEDVMRLDADIRSCDLIAHPIFAIISSCITFWIPCIIMSAIYIRVFMEANRQEQAIADERKRLRNQLEVQPAGSYRGTQTEIQNDLSFPPTPELNERDRKGTGTDSIRSGDRGSRIERKLKRERKAAKTLAIIMGAFILCWLPFFTWYTLDFVIFSGDMIPPHLTWLIDFFFWIGYLNSALNPIIYAYFNRDFRHAFKKLLYWDRCTKPALRCGGRRGSDAAGGNGFLANSPLKPLPDNSSN